MSNGLRAQANLTVSFGLVNIGIAIQKMIEDDDAPKGHLYCEEHKSSVKQQYVCATHGEVVDNNARVTGYEWDGKTVYMTDGERAACVSEKDGRIALTHYVPVADIDPLYFEKPYFVWAQKGHEDGFALIRDELRESGRALIGKSTLNKTTRLLVIRWSENTGTLIAHLCNFEAHVRRQLATDIQARDIESKPEARAMAAQLLASLEAEFDPGMVTDEYNDQLRAAITAKVKGVKPTTKAEDTPADMPDLMAALRAQVEDVKKRKAVGGTKKPNPKNRTKTAA